MTGYVCGCDFHGLSLKSLSNLFVFIPNTPLSHLERNPATRSKIIVQTISSSRDEFKISTVLHSGH